MDYPRIPSYRNAQVNASQPLEPTGSQALRLHPNALSPAKLSSKAKFALDRIETQPDGRHQLLALLVRHGINDGSLQFQSSQGAEAHYKQDVDAPSGTSGERQAGNLIVRMKLNEQSEYDILGVNYQVFSSGATASISLDDPPPAVTSNNAPSGSEDQQSSHFAVLNSRSQFTQASIGLREHLDVSRKSDQTGRFDLSPTSPASLLPSSSTSVASKAKGKVPDPENPGMMIFQSTLNKRKYGRKLVPDPEKPGRMATNNALNKRNSDRQQVPDPQNPGQMISRGMLSHWASVPDPDHPGQTITRMERAKLKNVQNPVPDPDKPGATVTQRTLYKRTSGRIQMEDPDNPNKTITKNILNRRKYNLKRAGTEKSGTNDDPQAEV